MNTEDAPLLRWLPHLVLGALATIELLVASALHQGEDELRTQAELGSAAERVWALHVLANRDPANAGFDGKAISALLEDDEPLVVDFVFTVDFCRLATALERGERPPSRQEARIRSRIKGLGELEKDREPLADWWRRFVIYCRKVGGRTVGGTLRLQRREVGWYFDALAGRALDEEALIESTNERKEQSYMLNLKRGGNEAPEDRPLDGAVVPGSQRQ